MKLVKFNRETCHGRCRPVKASGLRRIMQGRLLRRIPPATRRLMIAAKWAQRAPATTSASSVTMGDRAHLRRLILTAIARAHTENEAESAEALQAILDSMDVADGIPFAIDLNGLCYRA